MKNNKGFTLTEILLAAMIVGLIGVALAALTTSAARESGIARTRIVLREQLSSALRQLRLDIEQSSEARIYNGGFNLELKQQATAFPRIVDIDLWAPFFNNPQPKTITYSFKQNGNNDIGGSLVRTQRQQDKADETKNVLSNVKFVSLGNFASPSFTKGLSGSGECYSDIRVRIVVEVPTTPVVNDAVEEIFSLPNGICESNN